MVAVSKLNIIILSFVLSFSLFWSGQTQAEVLSGVELSGLSFISEDYANTEQKSYGFIGAHLTSYNSKSDVFKINLHGQYALGTPILSYINLREIYFTYAVDANSAVHIGRKMHRWSQVDEMWNLGLFQPQFRWSPLSVENQGLFGVFFDRQSGDMSFHLFGTPFHVPDQGPSYELKDGQFVASNPYFTPPPQNIYFQNTLLPIDYNVIEPEFTDVVMQPSFGIQLKYGGLTEGFYSSIAGMYKPSQQFAMGYQGILVTDRVRIDIKPKTYYEKNINFDAGYTAEWGDLGLSVLYNEAQKVEFEANYNTPILNANTTVSPYLKLDLQPVTLAVSILINDGGNVLEEGPEADADRQSLTQKFLYQNAYQVDLSYSGLISEDLRLTSGVKWLETEKNLLKLLKWATVLDVRGPWKFTFDMFLVETNEEATNVSSYRNLDQAWLGVVYDF